MRGKKGRFFLPLSCIGKAYFLPPFFMLLADFTSGLVEEPEALFGLLSDFFFISSCLYEKAEYRSAIIKSVFGRAIRQTNFFFDNYRENRLLMLRVKD